MEPGRGALDREPGQPLAERRHEPVAPAAVRVPRPGHVAVVLAVLEQVRERQLVDRR